MGFQRHVPAALPPEHSPGTHCAGSWVDLGAGLDVYGKSLLPPVLEPRNVQPAASSYIDYSIPASRTVTGSVLKLMCLGLLAKGLEVSLLLTLALRMTTPVSSETSTRNPVPRGARTHQTRPLTLR